jgi:acetylornithine deacetylase/succinyl-diaminopimelate desuccinylase-like protein
MSSPAAAIAYARANRPRFLAELKDFIRIPSISVQPRHAVDVKKCAKWLAEHLKKIGLERVRMVPAAGGPMVYGQWLRAAGRPTVLVYGHYDVQPVDPVSQWQTPPFDPLVKGGNLHGRGASDDKGQMFTHVKAMESYLRGGGGLPVNVKCLFEGEEELLSPSLPGFVERNRRALASDVAVLSDAPMLGPNRPTLTYSTRGQLGLELEVLGPRHDLHCGNFGGALHNPLQALCEILAQLYDKDGHVAIPGFYQRVRLASEREREYMQHSGPPDEQILHDAETESGWGERGYSLYERVAVRPALTINGISGGYQGVGGKGVIPARALAKLSFRLVPEQEPREVERLFRRHIARITPKAVKCAVRVQSSSNPAVIDRRHPALRAARMAYRKGFGRTPVFLRLGGSIPAVSIFQRVLGAPTVLMGYALPTNRIHAPNEIFPLPDFYKGIETNIWFLSQMGKEAGRSPRFRGRPALHRQMTAIAPANGS